MDAPNSKPPHWPAGSGLITHSGAIYMVTEMSITDHYEFLRPFLRGTPCMTGAVESREEDTVLKRKLLRQNLKIESWAV